MKFRLKFKTPYIKDQLKNYPEYIDDDHHATSMDRVVDKFVRYSEYITVEFDSETGTARVLEV